ncbi:cell division protein FtsA [Ornithinibacillus halophilus]|uniref:Cell division protein FtsA n=1 Tax=Ornithinibacillus halophilus TaxID=930117 RepID=A0A1M5ELP0_9BACI|nr:pilus assembly protein PilM [Ornithinibacillus halophilus]SHF79942.1 cell division protein FtsA [Ornithinibacillus halophilus]
MENNPIIFALDIGTRSVTGIILKEENEHYTLLDYCSIEHKVRSMHDGQIHNVEEVANVISQVKRILEDKHGELKRVSVAAAGRSLKTIQSTASININQQPITQKTTIKHLELSAVHSAQVELANQETNNHYSNYYCVGYSVLYYKIDNEQIGSLIDQSGMEASVEIIATFLPKVVIESLLSALERTGLEMQALTLEPIAAIDVLIPESMRRLNVALVDIGAGTSDIAITNNGTVVAYGMVPVAGDEITESISDQYLLDFPLAEQAKRDIVTNGEAVITDILGFENTITYDQLLQDNKPNIEKLAHQIAEEIYRLNKKSPKAVMLIGGGSLTPELTTLLAEKLQLPSNRVAIRGMDAIQTLKKTDNIPSGPNFVTPIGIAISANRNPVHYITTTVNDQILRMFEVKQLTVGDCLVQAGMKINRMYGKPGMASIVKLNGKEITIPGEFGQAPTLLLNNQKTSVETAINDGDSIIVKPGKNGKAASITLEELIGSIPTISIFYNEELINIPGKIYVNGSTTEKTYLVQDNDNIVIKYPNTIEEFFDWHKLEIPSTNPFTITVDGKNLTLADGKSKILLNNKVMSLNTPIKSGDKLDVLENSESTVKDLLNHLKLDPWHHITVLFNGEQVELVKKKLVAIRDKQELQLETTIHPNDRITLKECELEPFIFQDVFRYVEIDLTNASGKFDLLKSNQPTTFYDTIMNGDQLEIKFH